MAPIFSILALVAGLASFVFFIIVLIELFKTKGVLHVILGITCEIYTYIWGWIVADEKGLKKTMVNWTLAIIAQIVLQGLGFVFGGGIPKPPAMP